MTSRLLRVVHVVPSLRIGGLERLVVDLVRYADRERFEPRVLCITERGELALEVENFGLTVDTLNAPAGRNFRLPLVLSRYLRDCRADVVHTHGPYAHIYGALSAALRARPALVHTIHGQMVAFNWRGLFLRRIAASLSSTVIAVSSDLADRMLAMRAVAPTKLKVIHNGINLDAFQASDGISPALAPTAVMVARLAPPKDFVTLFEAVAVVRRKQPSFQLRLIGDGPIRCELETLSDRMGLADAVHFAGAQSNVAAHLRGCRLFVLSTRSEGLPIALLEGMAAGLPTVATDVGGNREIIVEGVTGFLVPTESPQDLANRMLWLLEHPTDAEEMGQAGRLRVEEHFDIRKCVAAYESLYAKLAKVPCQGAACELELV